MPLFLWRETPVGNQQTSLIQHLFGLHSKPLRSYPSSALPSFAQQRYVPVEGHTDLVRDTNSHAIVNRNRSAYELAKKRAADAQRQRDEIRNTTREINILKCEMHEIKSLLQELVGKT